MEPRPRGRGNPHHHRAQGSRRGEPSMEPRPRGRGNEPLWDGTFPFDLPLQWSPDLAAGETAGYRRAFIDMEFPSMEPRPRGRGNFDSKVKLPRIPHCLQWSPDLAAGETGGYTGEVAINATLQ